MLYPNELQAHAEIETPLKYGRGREIRTPDPLLPKQMRYQTALYPEKLNLISRAMILYLQLKIKTINKNFFMATSGYQHKDE